MKKRISLLMALAMFVAIFAGCVAEGVVIENQPPAAPAEPAAPAAPADPAAPTEPAQAAPAEEAVFKIGFNYWWPDSKNPFTAAWAITESVYERQVYEALYSASVNNEWEPRLAESYEVSDDGLTWTFHLRQGVKWHDGEDFNADDVVFTYNAVKEFEAGDYNVIKSIVEITKVDDYTVTMRTEEPKADFFSCFTLIVPEHIFGQHTASKEEFLEFDNADFIGTGPFKFEKEITDQYVEFVANDEYWGGRPKIDRLMYVVYTSDDTMLQALIAGEIDYCGLKAEQEETASQASGITVERKGSSTFYELIMNSWQDPANKGNPLIQDKNIRHAIDMAIDYEKICKYGSLGELAVPEYAYIPTFVTDFHFDFTKEDFFRPFDPEKAKALLEENGFIDRDGDGIRESADGAPLDFRFAVIESDYRETGLIIQANLKDIGINTQIEFVDSGRQSEMIYDQDFDIDMAIWGWSPSNIEPSKQLSWMTTEAVGGNSDCFFSNAEYDELYELQKVTIDKTERKAIIKRMCEIIYEECPYLMIYSSVGLYAYDSENWTGYINSDGGTGGVNNFFTLMNLEYKK